MNLVPEELEFNWTWSFMYAGGGKLVGSVEELQDEM